MREAIDLSVSKMRPTDVQAMATYLHSLQTGGQRYRDNCASCHQNNGDGMRGLPALRNHPVLRQPNADNVAMAILDGVWPGHRQGMPGFAAELTDSQPLLLTLARGGMVVAGLLLVLWPLLLAWRRKRKA